MRRPFQLPGRRGLLFHLAALILTILIPALGLGAVAALSVARSHRDTFEAQMVAVARATAASLDDVLDSHLALGRGLAASPTLATGDIAAFEAEARATGAALDTWVSLVNPGPEYRRLVNTALPPGARPDYGGLVLPLEQAPIPRVFAEGQPRVTNVGRSIALNRPTALVLVPVQRDGVVTHVIGIGFEPARIGRLLQGQQLFPGFVATVMDGRGRIIGSSHRHAELVGQQAPAWIAGTPEGVVQSATDSGDAILGTVVQARRAPWRVAITAPAGAASAAVTQPLLILAGGGALLLLAAAALAAWLARRVTTPIWRLAQAAGRAAAEGGAGLRDVPPAPVAEIEVLRRALLDADRRIEEQRSRERDDAARQRLLTAELSHRVKNALTVVQSTVRLTPRADAASFASAIEGRITALARATSMLAETEWSGADLGQLVAAELAPFTGPARGGPVVTVEGPAVTLPPAAVQPLAIVVHELATNAVKHGALAVMGGRLDIAWAREADGGLRFTWSEGGRELVAPNRTGFGTRVLDATVQAQLGGTLSREWRPIGLLCSIHLPARLWERPETAHRSPAAPDEGRNAAGPGGESLP